MGGDQGASAFGAGQSAALGSGAFAAADSNTSYIDSAIPRTQIRIRGDFLYDDNRPDRAEFFYPKCGCFKVAGIDPNAPGPPRPERRVDAQEILTYVEYAPVSWLSGFVEAPFRFINPDRNDNASGFGDLNAGVKVVIWRSCDTYLTAQVRGYFGTGDAFKGLGTNHTSIEPALLLWHRFGERLTLEAEARYWTAIDGTDFAGEFIRYGVGLSYDVVKTPTFKITPVAEVVGWSVLNGKESTLTDVLDAGGDTIVNAKAGLRFTYKDHQSLSVSYGRALTGEVWYKDIARIEYRWQF
jgi:hypothetical protein